MYVCICICMYIRMLCILACMSCKRRKLYEYYSYIGTLDVCDHYWTVLGGLIVRRI